MKKSVPHLIQDEEQAIRDYKDSEKESKNPSAKKVFRHIRPEEEHHKKELKEVKERVAHKMK